VFVSAKSGLNLDKLCEQIRRRTQTSMTVEVTISADCSDALNFIYRNASVISSDMDGNNITFGLSIKRTIWGDFLSKFENVASKVTVIEC
jgi:50S ribosomal subunit-associated GTPase HflX